MATPIYKLGLFRQTEAWFKMPERERADLQAKVKEALTSVGGQWVLMCDSGWSSEQWPMFVIEKYPDIEAVQKFSRAWVELGGSRLYEVMTILGTEMQQG